MSASLAAEAAAAAVAHWLSFDCRERERERERERDGVKKCLACSEKMCSEERCVLKCAAHTVCVCVCVCLRKYLAAAAATAAQPTLLLLCS